MVLPAILDGQAGFAVDVEVRVVGLAASGEEEVLGRATVTMALERLPDGRARIAGIPDFMRDRATQEWLEGLAADGHPLQLQFVLKRAGDAPRRLTSPAGFGRTIGQALTSARRLLAYRRSRRAPATSRQPVRRRICRHGRRVARDNSSGSGNDDDGGGDAPPPAFRPFVSAHAQAVGSSLSAFPRSTSSEHLALEGMRRRLSRCNGCVNSPFTISRSLALDRAVPVFVQDLKDLQL